MRDPKELGLQLLNHPKTITITSMADLLDREYQRREVEKALLASKNGKPQGE